MPSFVSRVNNFFFVSRKFFAETVSRFLKARGAFMPPFAFEVNNFFPFRETFCSTVEPAVFLQSRGAVMLPLNPQVNHFFTSWRISPRLNVSIP